MTSSLVSFVVGAFLYVLSLACASAPRTTASPAESPTAATEFVDLRELSAPGTNLERLLAICQPYTSSNFTYTAEVAALLKGTRVMVQGSPRMRRADVSRYLSGVLESNGFACQPVGAEHLRVVRIVRRES